MPGFSLLSDRRVRIAVVNVGAAVLLTSTVLLGLYLGLETNRRLQKLQADGKPVSIVVYPEVEHGLYAFEDIDGERLSTRQPASLLPLLVDFARNGRLQEAYEAAVIRRQR